MLGKRGVAAVQGPGRVRVRDAERRFLRLLGGRSERDVEYDFAFRNIAGSGLRVLDVGGCDSLLPRVLARYGHRVTVYDYRRYTERHRNLSVLSGDFLQNSLGAASFDIILLVSTIEHIGLGAYGDPLRADADFEVMKEARRLLAARGKLVLTLPFNEQEIVMPGFEHWYSPGRVERLLDGWSVCDQEFWRPDKKILGRWVRWRPTVAEEAAGAYRAVGMHGLACFALSGHR